MWPEFEQFVGLAVAILAGSPVVGYGLWLWRPDRGDVSRGGEA